MPYLLPNREISILQEVNRVVNVMKLPRTKCNPNDQFG